MDINSTEEYVIEMCLRIRVGAVDQGKFLKGGRELIKDTLQTTDVERATPEVWLLQPIIGSAPFEWELRVRHKSLGSAGDFLDRFDREFQKMQEKLDSARWVESVESGGISLFRVWNAGASTKESAEDR